MMKVLKEQEVASRRRGRRAARAATGRIRQRRPSRRRSSRLATEARRAGLAERIRTAVLSLLTLALAVSLAFLVPQLEAEAQREAENDGDLLRAEGPGLPSLRSGLVEFERTDDVEYIVTEGETLSEIAIRFEIDYETLARYNDLSDPHSISADQLIVIPGTTSGLLRSEE